MADNDEYMDDGPRWGIDVAGPLTRGPRWGTGPGPDFGPFPAQINGVPVPIAWLAGPGGPGGPGSLVPPGWGGYGALPFFPGYAGYGGGPVTLANATSPGAMPGPPVPVSSPHPAFGFVDDKGKVWSGVLGFALGALATAVGFLAAGRRR